MGLFNVLHTSGTAKIIGLLCRLAVILSYDLFTSEHAQVHGSETPIKDSVLYDTTIEHGVVTCIMNIRRYADHPMNRRLRSYYGRCPLRSLQL